MTFHSRTGLLSTYLKSDVERGSRVYILAETFLFSRIDMDFEFVGHADVLIESVGLGQACDDGTECQDSYYQPAIESGGHIL